MCWTRRKKIYGVAQYNLHKDFFDACELQLQMFLTWSFLNILDSSFPPQSLFPSILYTRCAANTHVWESDVDWSLCGWREHRAYTVEIRVHTSFHIEQTEYQPTTGNIEETQCTVNRGNKSQKLYIFIHLCVVCVGCIYVFHMTMNFEQGVTTEYMLVTCIAV